MSVFFFFVWFSHFFPWRHWYRLGHELKLIILLYTMMIMYILFQIYISLYSMKKILSKFSMCTIRTAHPYIFVETLHNVT